MNRLTYNSFSSRTNIATITMLLLAGCATAPFSQDMLPSAVQVPIGHVVVLESTGTGKIAYECRTKMGNPAEENPEHGQPRGNADFAWALVGPDAKLTDRSGKIIGRYYGPPVTWESSDGSIITGAQVAIAPATAGNLPLQLVKANPATGRGRMVGTTFIQRVATKGGVAPSSACDAAAIGKKEIVNYQADYIFYKAE